MFTSLFRAESDRSPGSDFWFGPVGRRTSAGVRVTPESAMRHSAVLACVRVHAESMAVLPFKLYRKSKLGRGRVAVSDHWVYRLLNTRPNRFQTPFAWREMLQGHQSLRGNGYCEIVDDGRGGVAELLPLHPVRTKLEMLDNGSWRYRVADAAGRERVLRRDQVWHLRGLSDDGVMGLSPIDLGREAVGGAIAAAEYSNRFWSNDAKPASGWVTFPGKFANNEARRQYREQLQEHQAGRNRGKLLVLDQGMTYQEVGISNKDAQFLEARGFSVSEIARLFRVPPHKIGDLSRSTNNNIEHQSLEFWVDCMLPWAGRWAASIKCDLLHDDDDEFEVEFDFKRLLKGDATSRSNYLARMVLAGIITRNEAREEEGMNPIDGLDEPLVPTNMAADDDFSERPAPGEQSPKPKAPKPAPPAEEEEEADALASVRVFGLAAAAAQRLARKEANEIQRLMAAKAPAEQLLEAYQKHARVVSAALAVEQSAADAYCVSQANLAGVLSAADYQLAAEERLRLLALTGRHDTDTSHT